MKTVFMGTSEFAVFQLEELLNKGHEVGYVVTQPDRPGNRKKMIPSPVKAFAMDKGLHILQPDNISRDEHTMDLLRSCGADVFVVAAYGQILSREVLDMPALGCYNVHGSILPKYRGASPIQQAILQGDAVTGVTIMKMEEGLDCGDILAVSEVETGRMNFTALQDALGKAGAALLTSCLKDIQEGTAEFTPQDESKATYTTRVKKSDGKMDMELPADRLERYTRAYDPWPGAFCSWKGENLKIWSCDPGPQIPGKRPGEVVYIDGKMIICCGEGSLQVNELQVPGKRRMSAEDYLKGNRIPEGTVLE